MKSSKQIDKLLAEQSAEWQEVLQRGDDRDLAAFAQWSLKSPQHMRHFLMMMALDRELMHLDPERRLAIPPAVEPDAATVVPLHEPAEEVAVDRRWTSRRRWIAAAAVVGALALLATLQFVSDRFAGGRQFATAQGEQRAVELKDGSIMQLNTQSKAEVRFSADRRDVYLLGGEALFKVAKDPARPFRVHTADMVIQAVGTQFNVYAQRGGTVVSVLEGRVLISPDKRLTTAPAESSASLSAGQQAKVGNGGRIESRETIDTTTIATWRQRRLVFNQNPLSEVVTEFNRYNRTPQFRVMDGAVGDKPYSGAFDADDPESLVELLGVDPDLELETRGTEILIRRR